MDFLKNLFNGESLTYEQLAEKIKAGKLTVANIADGTYVSRSKFDDETGKLKKQVDDLQGQLTKRDTDMSDLQTKLTAAQNDQTKLTEVQNTLDKLKNEYDQSKNDWNAKLAQQAYEFAVKTEAAKLNFSSTAAQRDFIRGVLDKKLQMQGDTILGFNDYVESYKKEDPGAFVKEDSGKNPPPDDNGGKGNPAIVLPSTKQNQPEKNPFDFHFSGVRPKPTEQQ